MGPSGNIFHDTCITACQVKLLTHVQNLTKANADGLLCAIQVSLANQNESCLASAKWSFATQVPLDLGDTGVTGIKGTDVVNEVKSEKSRGTTQVPLAN